MPDYSFNTAAGQTVKRELLAAYLNVGTAATPVWAIFGKRVTDSSMDYDWGADSSKDIIGETYTTLQKPVITQSFDPYYLDGGDAALKRIWDLAVKDQDYNALASQDVLIVHLYAGTSGSAMFAERYTGCSIQPSSLGGEGGGNVAMPIDVTYGGTRTTGTAAISGGVVTFTPDAETDLPKLSALSIGDATLTPTFSANVNSYTATAGAATGAVTATAATQGSTVVILVNGNSLSSGGTATWSEGDNLVRVTVGYGGKTNDYEVRVSYTAG